MEILCSGRNLLTVSGVLFFLDMLSITTNLFMPQMKFNEPPSKYYVVNIQCAISTPQFKTPLELEMFLKNLLEDLNGTEYRCHAVPVVHSQEAY